MLGLGYSARCPGTAPLIRLVLLPLLFAATACTSRSDVVELSPGVFALTVHSATPAASARLGVEQARAHCAQRQLGFEPVRTLIGARDYQIAFRCPPAGAEWLTPPDPDATSPAFLPAGSLQ